MGSEDKSSQGGALRGPRSSRAATKVAQKGAAAEGRPRTRPACQARRHTRVPVRLVCVRTRRSAPKFSLLLPVRLPFLGNFISFWL